MLPGLFQEVQRLMEEKRDVQRQAEKDRESYEKRERELEQMVEELQVRLVFLMHPRLI